MSKEEIHKRNEAIARFMGFEYYPFKEEEKGLMFGWIKKGADRGKLHPKVSRGLILCRTTKDMRYNNSWDWLMSVVIKMIDTNYPDGDNIYLRTFGLINEETGEYMVRFNRQGLFQSGTLLNALFLAVSDYCLNFNSEEKK